MQAAAGHRRSRMGGSVVREPGVLERSGLLRAPPDWRDVRAELSSSGRSRSSARRPSYGEAPRVVVCPPIPQTRSRTGPPVGRVARIPAVDVTRDLDAEQRCDRGYSRGAVRGGVFRLRMGTGTAWVL